jgi:hypothetical protein
MKISRAVAIIAALASIYILVVLLSGFGWNPFGQRWTFENAGQFGDAFGPLNTLMAGLAAAGAIAAYLAQREELERIREESVGERTLAYKRDFENTFFNLVELLRDTVNDIEITDQYGQHPLGGRDGLKRLLEDRIGQTRGTGQADGDVYRDVYFKNRDDLGHYFRLFYHIIRFVDESSIDEKKLYIRIVRATLSNAEIVLLALNCLYGGGKEKFKPLVERYSLLHNISSTDALGWRFEQGFDPSAFGDRDLVKDASN